MKEGTEFVCEKQGQRKKLQASRKETIYFIAYQFGKERLREINFLFLYPVSGLQISDFRLGAFKL